MYIYIYICVYIYIYIYVCIYTHISPGIQDSSKVGAVETGCSDLYDVMY